MALLLFGCSTVRIDAFQPEGNIEAIAMDIAEDLEDISADLEKVGTLSVSSASFIAKPEKQFAFNLDLTPRQIFERARVEGTTRAVQERSIDHRIGVALNLMNQANRMFATNPAMAEYTAKLAEYNLAVAAMQGAAPSADSGDEEDSEEGEDSTDAAEPTDGQATSSAEDPGTPPQPLTMEPTQGELPQGNNALGALSSSSFPAPIPTRSPDTLDMNLRDLIQLTFDDHTTLKMLEWFSQPTGLGSNIVTHACLFMVNCSPGYITSEGYIGEVDVRVEYAIQELNGKFRRDGIGEPLAFAVFPAVGGQVLDVRSSARNQIARAVRASFADREIGAEGQFDDVERTLRDSASLTTLNTVVGYNRSGRNFGWRFAPRFMAQADPSSDVARAGMRLQQQTFPALVMMQFDKAHLAEEVGGYAGNGPSSIADFERVAAEEVELEELLKAQAEANAFRIRHRARLVELEAKYKAYLEATSERRRIDALAQVNGLGRTASTVYAELDELRELKKKAAAASPTKSAAPSHEAWEALYKELDEMAALEKKAKDSEANPLVAREQVRLLQLQSAFKPYTSVSSPEEKLGALQALATQRDAALKGRTESDRRDQQWQKIYADLDRLADLKGKAELSGGEEVEKLRLLKRFKNYDQAKGDDDARLRALQALLPAGSAAQVGPAPGALGSRDRARLAELRVRYQAYLNAKTEDERVAELKKLITAPEHGVGSCTVCNERELAELATLRKLAAKHKHAMEGSARLKVLSEAYPKFKRYVSAKLRIQANRARPDDKEICDRYRNQADLWNARRERRLPLEEHYGRTQEFDDLDLVVPGGRSTHASHVTIHTSFKWVRAPNVASDWRSLLDWEIESAFDCARHPRLRETTTVGWAVKLSRVERRMRALRRAILCEGPCLDNCPDDPFLQEERQRFVRGADKPCETGFDPYLDGNVEFRQLTYREEQLLLAQDYEPLVEKLHNLKAKLRVDSIGRNTHLALPKPAKAKSTKPRPFALQTVAPRRGWYDEESWFVVTGAGFTTETRFIVGGIAAIDVAVSANGKAAVIRVPARTGEVPVDVDIAAFDPGAKGPKARDGGAERIMDGIRYAHRKTPRPAQVSELMVQWDGTGRDRRVKNLQVFGPVSAENVLQALFGRRDNGGVSVQVGVGASAGANVPSPGR